ncbi:MAG: restriction endonuclease subunit S [Cytophagales bacterium]|jgi:type I restriction enzyme S subunit|nr:restriction endonuclease subunit S [Cytophagales bacterium]
MKNWEVEYLDDVCELITCGVAARPNYVDEGVPFLSAKNVKDGQIIWSGYNCISEETHKELTKNSKPLKGDLLYTRVGSYGEAAVIEDDYEFSVFVSLTLIKVDKSKLNNYYLKHYLNSEAVKNLAKASISGSGVGNLNVGTVRKFKIPLPPLPEQQRIVSILDEAFACIERSRNAAIKNLKNAKELFESYLQGVFEKKGDGWEEQLLEDCFKMKSGDNLTAKNMTEGEYPVFGGNGIAGYHNEYNLSGSNVIIGRVGALCGNVRHIKENIWLTDNAFKLVDFKFDFDHSFLTYLLNYKDLRSYARQAAQPVISNSSLKDVVLSFPKSKEAQQTIVRKLDALRAETQKLEAVYQKKIDDLEELKKSILQKAFAGELKTEKALAL